MHTRKSRLKKIARLSAPFVLLAVLALAGADEETMTGGFLVAVFLSYLLLPSLELGRRSIARD